MYECMNVCVYIYAYIYIYMHVSLSIIYIYIYIYRLPSSWGRGRNPTCARRRGSGCPL